MRLTQQGNETIQQKLSERRVNIFRKYSYYLTPYLSTHYKTYCFAFQKRRFCTVKAALLRCKTYAFAMPNRNYGFPSELSLQNQCYTPPFPTQFYPQTIALLSVCDSSRSSQFTLLFLGVRNVMKHVPDNSQKKIKSYKNIDYSCRRNRLKIKT